MDMKGGEMTRETRTEEWARAFIALRELNRQQALNDARRHSLCNVMERLSKQGIDTDAAFQKTKEG
jgi:hypothetical protein